MRKKKCPLWLLLVLMASPLAVPAQEDGARAGVIERVHPRGAIRIDGRAYEFDDEELVIRSGQLRLDATDLRPGQRVRYSTAPQLGGFDVQVEWVGGEPARRRLVLLTLDRSQLRDET